jgi:hypothetical protein
MATRSPSIEITNPEQAQTRQQSAVSGFLLQTMERGESPAFYLNFCSKRRTFATSKMSIHDQSE